MLLRLLHQSISLWFRLFGLLDPFPFPRAVLSSHGYSNDTYPRYDTSGVSELDMTNGRCALGVGVHMRLVLVPSVGFMMIL